MKTKVNSMYYTEVREAGNIYAKIKISVNDECKNGYNHFSVTGEIWEEVEENFYRRIPRGDKMIHKNKYYYLSCCGCCHDDLVKIFPEYQNFIKLHLCDTFGVSMYSVANGFYYLQQDKNLQHLSEFLRLKTDEELNIIAKSEDKIVFAFHLIKLGIVERWRQEAVKAIQELEKILNTSFEDNSIFEKTHLYEIEKYKHSFDEIENKMKEGFFAADKIEERKKQEKEKCINARREELIKRFNEKIKKEKEDLQVNIYILESGILSGNYIYYDHKKEVVFNWLDYKDKITQEEFIDFLNKVDYSKLPENIKFSLKE